MTVRRIGVFGGTFDPIHKGHIDIATAAEAALGLTRLYLVPSHVPPHRGEPRASSYHRFAMVALSVAGRNGWIASDLELGTSAPSYTTTTLARFHEHGYAASELFFVIGADAFTDIDTWKDYPGLLDQANFAVVSRPGCPVSQLPQRLPGLAARMVVQPVETLSSAAPSVILIDAPTADVSSTAIRERRANGASIEGMVEPAVQQHIEQHALYSENPVEGRATDAPRTAAGRLHGQG